MPAPGSNWNVSTLPTCISGASVRLSGKQSVADRHSVTGLPVLDVACVPVRTVTVTCSTTSPPAGGGGAGTGVRHVPP
jgi:hypothetical protein